MSANDETWEQAVASMTELQRGVFALLVVEHGMSTLELLDETVPHGSFRQDYLMAPRVDRILARRWRQLLGSPLPEPLAAVVPIATVVQEADTFPGRFATYLDATALPSANDERDDAREDEAVLTDLGTDPRQTLLGERVAPVFDAVLVAATEAVAAVRRGAAVSDVGWVIKSLEFGYGPGGFQLDVVPVLDFARGFDGSVSAATAARLETRGRGLAEFGPVVRAARS